MPSPKVISVFQEAFPWGLQLVIGLCFMSQGDQENFSNSRPASHNLHSLPDYYNGSAHGISYNSFSSAADSSIDANPRY